MPLGPAALSTRSFPTQSSLFPLSKGVVSWTTSPDLPHALPLANSTLNPIKVIKELPLTYVDDGPNGKRGLKVHYPKGSYTLNSNPRGGISFYSHGPTSPALHRMLDLAKEATFAYSVYFPEGFEFVKGGKLPGLFGGNSDELSYSCSGGRKDTTCFSCRLMWRTNGAGEIYAYFPPYDVPGFEANRALCEAKGNVCDNTYGISIGRGNFTFGTGQWTTVAQRVRLNDAGVANGEVQLWVDGKSVIESRGIILTDESGSGRIRGIQAQSFFGGNSVDWATPIDQDIYLSDFSVAVIEELGQDNSRRALDARAGEEMAAFSTPDALSTSARNAKVGSVCSVFILFWFLSLLRF